MAHVQADEPLIGPNAVIQTAAALTALCGREAAQRVFAQAGLSRYLTAAPAAMLPLREVAALNASLAQFLPPERAAAVAAEAGRRTADYLLANRIPALAQRALRLSPRWLAARLLLRAIAANAWTYAGGARVRGCVTGGAAVVEIDGGATDACGCLWRQAVFQRLFAALVNPDAQARAAGCRLGAAPCRYEITLTPQEGRPPCTPPSCTPPPCTQT